MIPHIECITNTNVNFMVTINLNSACQHFTHNLNFITKSFSLPRKTSWIHGVAFSDKVVNLIRVIRKHITTTYQTWQMFICQLFGIVSAQKLLYCVHISLSNLPCWVEPARGARPCGNYESTTLKFAHVPIIYVQLVYTRLCHIFFRHKYFIQA